MTRRTRSLSLLVLLAAVACDSSPTVAPVAERLSGVLDGTALRLPAGALLIRSAGRPDSLVVGGGRSDLAIRVHVEYTGPGSYPLGRDEVEIVVLVGGDVKTGGYLGSADAIGALVVTEDEGPGGWLRAELAFDAEHAGGFAPFGPTVALRDGRLVARLQTYSP